jgi:hypothetical protein
MSRSQAGRLDTIAAPRRVIEISIAATDLIEQEAIVPITNGVARRVRWAQKIRASVKLV